MTRADFTEKLGSRLDTIRALLRPGGFGKCSWAAKTGRHTPFVPRPVNRRQRRGKGTSKSLSETGTRQSVRRRHRQLPSQMMVPYLVGSSERSVPAGDVRIDRITGIFALGEQVHAS